MKLERTTILLPSKKQTIKRKLFLENIKNLIFHFLILTRTYTNSEDRGIAQTLIQRQVDSSLKRIILKKRMKKNPTKKTLNLKKKLINTEKNLARNIKNKEQSQTTH